MALSDRIIVMFKGEIMGDLIRKMQMSIRGINAGTSGGGSNKPMSDNVKKRDILVIPGLGGLVLSGTRPIIAILLAFTVSAIMIIAQGANPFEAYWAMLRGSFGSVAALANTCVRAALPLLEWLGLPSVSKLGY
jgi:hypothetical protein